MIPRGQGAGDRHAAAPGDKDKGGSKRARTPSTWCFPALAARRRRRRALRPGARCEVAGGDINTTADDLLLLVFFASGAVFTRKTLEESEGATCQAENRMLVRARRIPHRGRALQALGGLLWVAVDTTSSDRQEGRTERPATVRLDCELLVSRLGEVRRTNPPMHFGE